jgi:hypothetical protein
MGGARRAPVKHPEAAQAIPQAQSPTVPPVQQPEIQPTEVQQPPPTPEEMPAQPPKVSFTGGQLSIIADNSTLGDVLNAVKKLTGASVDMPGSATNERVAVALGPGTPEVVLQQLFAGSKFDYIILGSPTNPAAVDKIILSQRGTGAIGPANNVAYPPPRQSYQPPPPPDQNDDEVSEQPEPPEAPEQPEQQEQAQPQPTIGPGGEAAAQENNNQPKTPEQLLQELQRMQQQQQQGRPQRGPTPR